MTAASARAVVLAAVAVGLAAGLMATDAGQAAALAGADLTRLLRAMAALKALMAAGVIAAVVWRLGMAAAAVRLALYGLTCGGMAAGVGLIWGIAHVALGALLLHGGLIASLVLLWRDPVVGERFAAIVAARRATLRAR